MSCTEKSSPQVDPDLFTLQVRLQTCSLTPPKVSDVQTIDGNTELLGQQL